MTKAVKPLLPESDGCCYAPAPCGVFRDGQVLFSRQIGRVAMTGNRRTRFSSLPQAIVLAALLLGAGPRERAFAVERNGSGHPPRPREMCLQEPAIFAKRSSR